jgi:hypothetical protein
MVIRFGLLGCGPSAPLATDRMLWMPVANLRIPQHQLREKRTEVLAFPATSVLTISTASAESADGRP